MMKKICGVLALCLTVVMSVPCRAENPAAFSTIVYMTNEEAAPKLALYQGVTEQAAMEKLKASAKKAEKNGAIAGRVKPAYVYAHIDVGNGNLMELGALVTAARLPGEKLAFTDITGCYSRPVNRMLRWTPMSDVSAVMEGDAAVRLSVKGMVNVPAADETDAAGLQNAGFTAVLSGGKTVYQKTVALSQSIPAIEEAPVGQGDIAQAYLAMFRYYQEKTGIAPGAYPRMALDLRTPVGLNEAAKTGLLDALMKSGYTQVSEMDMETYYAAMNQDATNNALADCFFLIDRVAVRGKNVAFKIGGYAGPRVNIFTGTLEKGPEGWFLSEAGEQKSA